MYNKKFAYVINYNIVPIKKNVAEFATFLQTNNLKLGMHLKTNEL